MFRMAKHYIIVNKTFTKLDKLVKWQMLFNVWNCKFLHAGHGNLDVNDQNGDSLLGTTITEKV